MDKSVKSLQATTEGILFAQRLTQAIAETIENVQPECPDDNFLAYLNKALASQFLHFGNTELLAVDVARQYVQTALAKMNRGRVFKKHQTLAGYSRGEEQT